MKITEWTNKDGVTSYNYNPEKGDKVIALASSVYKSEPRPIIAYKGTPKERAVNIVTRGITSKWNDKEIFCQLTEGQTKVLDKAGDLMNKTIEFTEYDSDKYGKLVGARVRN